MKLCCLSVNWCFYNLTFACVIFILKDAPLLIKISGVSTVVGPSNSIKIRPRTAALVRVQIY